jgi:hypothetical protein
MGHPLRVQLNFTAEDQAWLRRSSITVPAFWDGHAAVPVVGDAIRLAGRQFVVRGRVWEHDGSSPVLRVMLGSGGAESDTAFGTL